MTTTVLLADDHGIVREGTRRILEARADLRVVAEARNGEEAVQAALAQSPDLALVDLTMPRLSGVEAIRRIRQHARTRCIALTMHETSRHVTEALAAGASAYVVKSGSASDLLSAVDAVRSGRSFLSSSIAHFVVEAVRHPGECTEPSLRNLTSREREVLQLVAEGNSSKEIAASLAVSVKTIETHRCHIMSKLKTRKTSQLVRKAIEEGLVAL